MSCVKSISDTMKVLNAASTTATEEWYTGWQSAIGLDIARMATKVQNMSAASLSYQPCLQTAQVRVDKPGPVTLLDVARTTTGENCTGDENVSAALLSKMFVRFGVQYKQSGAGFAKADVGLVTHTEQCGEVVGSWSGHLETTSSTEDRVVPVTGFLPALQAEKVMAAIIIGSLVGAFKCMLTWRTATTSPESPNAWATTDKEAAWHSINEETTTAEIATAVTADLWIQFGLKYRLSTGTALGQADVTVATCVRRV